ncbi:hypothetical protein CAPTEDRAFT_99819 [Capitella teleta]|uniref:G-protein coupled receptors family 3 profile domain-containing protein n=1 Tax=Capitella teleta TaxID=283909 RepID=R7UK63_CAPTE|nr:hypothetical protein CAPTEDRAFT_99819 [Capitella teleta]|eukprot:ELU06483.1 hypothetical protein CAPTEDRAFT_99819 [Capitella teleta]
MYSELFAFAVNSINEDDNILPNITLGFVAFMACGNELDILAKSLYFLPESSTAMVPTLEGYPESVALKTNYSGKVEPRHYSVSAVVGTIWSAHAVRVASLFGAFGLPLLSHYATSDQLSDKTKFPLFARTVPPDKFSTEALVAIAQHFKWTYVSLLYSDDSYGQYSGKRLEMLIREAGMCIAFNQRISANATDEDYEKAASKLWEYRKARVVFMVMTKQDPLFAAIGKLGLTHHFLFLSGDIFSSVAGNPGEGAIFVSHHSPSVPGYLEFAQSLTPSLEPANEWLAEAWQNRFHCSWDATSNNSCHSYSISDANETITTPNGRIYLSVYVYAHAMHQMIAERCPEQFDKVNKSKLRSCIDSSQLFNYMVKVNFTSLGVHVMFDQNGDTLGSYILMHWTANAEGVLERLEVGKWDKLTGELNLNLSAIDWTFLKKYEYFPTNDSEFYVPESVCSKPCKERQYYHYQEVSCCWECRECRSNERLAQNKTTCEVCPDFTWPDTPYECSPIQPFYLRVSDSILAQILLPLGIIGIGLTLLTSGALYYYRHHRLIRSTSRELSAVILVGALVCAASIHAFLLKPSVETCLLRLLGFHYGVNLLYSPLMVKTIRIYRIFSAGKRSVRRPRFISSGAQMVFTAVLVLLQVSHLHPTMIILSDTLWPITASLTQKLQGERYVELQCEQPQEAFLLPLSVNLAVIAVCSILAYLSRKLPENFNESFYLFVSSSTTSFAWAVVLPTYFSAFHAHQQAALLAFCLLLHTIVTLACSFAPKLYALSCVSDDSRLNVAGTLNTKVGPTPSVSTVHAVRSKTNASLVSSDC